MTKIKDLKPGMLLADTLALPHIVLIIAIEKTCVQIDHPEDYCQIVALRSDGELVINDMTVLDDDIDAQLEFHQLKDVMS